jgi:hypothetical protein
VIRGELRQEFVVANAGGCVEAGLRLDLLPDPERDVAGEGDPLQVFGDVEIGLVERQRFDDRGVLGEDVTDLPAERLAAAEVRLVTDGRDVTYGEAALRVR